MELAINNGILIDPRNKIHSKLNIGVSNGRVKEISFKELKADNVIDASGMVVAPGFIDAHMHEGDYNAEKDCFDTLIFECMLKMGVTTAIGGNCGGGPENPEQYLDAADRLGLPVNFALLVPHDTLRQKVGAKDKYSPVNAGQVEEMKEQAQKWLDAGCIGISFGIRYIPGIDRQELQGVAKAAVKSKKLIAAHIRDDAGKVIPSIEELLELAIKFGLPVQVSHIGSMGGYGQMDEVLALLDARRSEGIDVWADCYPYTAFSTCIGEATYDEGFLERYNTSYRNIEIAEGIYRGSRCTEELFKKIRLEAPDTITIGHVMKEAEIDKALVHPAVLIGSDGFIHGEQGHPRAAGTFPRVLSEYVRKRKLMSLDEAIGKMTWKTAERFGLPGGELSIGGQADIIVFDPEKVEDRASFENPTISPIGIKHVILGGRIAVMNGEIINGNLGKPLRR